MKLKLLFASFIFATSLMAQHLNNAGHLIGSNSKALLYKVEHTTEGSKVKVQGLSLKGNSVVKSKYGYVTLTGGDENVNTVLRLYTNNGKEIFLKHFEQTINFSMSPSGNFCAFHDRKKINTLNLLNHEIKSFNGSNVFSVDDQGNAAYYDDKSLTVNFSDQSAAVKEPVYRVLFFNAGPLFITRDKILLLKDHSLKTVFKVQGCRIFDANVFGDKLFVSVKKEKPDEFVFNSFSSSDLDHFEPGEEKHYPLAHHTFNNNLNSNLNSNKSTVLANELIVDPLYYYDDTVYQPVGNSYAEMQEYTIGSPYPHPGVDLLGTYLQEVYSVKKGYVKAVLTTSGQYHWRIAIANENTPGYSHGYLYAHLEETLIPYVVGDSVNAGDVIGQLVDFPVTGFVHCHFARIADSGAVWNSDWWTFDNPLTYMTNLFDSIAPQFEKTINNDEFAFRDINGNYLSPDSLFGNVRVISKVFDQVNAEWHVDVNKLRYSVSPLDTPNVMLLDSFAYEYDFYNDYYFLGNYYNGLLNTIYSRDANCYSTADYNVRDFYHIVTNSDGNDTIDGNDSLQLFNTQNLQNGSYIFRVIASDPSGNATADSMVIRIKNIVTDIHNNVPHSPVKIIPNPSVDGIFKIIREDQEDRQYEIYDSAGRKIISSLVSFPSTINLSGFDRGVYFLRYSNNNQAGIIKITKL